MSTVRFEKAALGAALFEQVPSPGKFQLKEGHFWNDATQKNILTQINGQAGSVVQGININSTPVTATNPSAAADLMTLALPAGFANVAGKTIYVRASGTYTTAGGQTPTLTFTVLFGAITPLTFVTSATTASVTKNWTLEAYLTTVTSGASGTFEAHGTLSAELGAGAAGSVAATIINDLNAAVSSTVDQTAAATLKLQGLMSSANAGNSIIQRQMIVKVIN